MGDVAISLILVGLAIAVSVLYRLAIERELVVSVVRAILQLVAVAAVIDAVFEALGWTALVLAVMVAAAGWTAQRRMKGVRGAAVIAVISICGSSVIAIAVLFGAGVFPFEPRWLIPISGMLIGNSMTAVSVAGARLRDEVVDKALEVEARLALGVSARAALVPYTRRAAVGALVPIIDSTKNVGIIFLPGAFVGMILGGASPTDAAKVQMIVLFMLLGAVAVAAMLATTLVGRSFIGAGERIVLASDSAP